MATIAKFYLHDAATPNSGTMPGAGQAFANTTGGAAEDATGDAAGARTARSADDVIGALQTSATITAIANSVAQSWGYRRFVSAPLAAHTFVSADGNWTFSYARSQSNTAHNQRVQCVLYFWRPSTGAIVGSTANSPNFFGTAPASTTEAVESLGTSWFTTTILDGDILVIEVADVFTQGMSTAYTSSFFYDGTTEASTTSCASFVAPPAALTLFSGAAAAPQPRPTVIGQAVQRAASRCWSKRRSGIFVPRLWTPEAA